MGTLENRTYLKVDKVQLLKKKNILLIDDSELEDCQCEPFLVLSSNSGNSWENDITGAWIKLGNNTDTCIFKLYNSSGVLTNYVPTPLYFKNDNYSQYVQIDWNDVFNSDGVGCYTLKLEYTIGGISDIFEWGEYEMYRYSYQLARKTVRLKSIFNSNQSIENINFTDSKVIDTIRFDGYFGDRQPQMEVDNIIYQDRILNKVLRENQNKYILTSKDLKKEHLEKIVDLHLLSENELYISDFNPTNPIDTYLDFPVIVSESPEIKYFDTSKKITLSCNFNDKLKNSRSFY